MNIIHNGMMSENQFRVDEIARQVDEIKQMIQDLEGKNEALKQHIKYEEERTHISDPKHFSYSSKAKAASQRSTNLNQSVTELKRVLEEKQNTLESEKEKLADSIENNNKMKIFAEKKNQKYKHAN